MLEELAAIVRTEGWIQERLARQLGVSQGHLSKILAKRVPLTRKVEARAASLLSSRGDQSTEHRPWLDAVEEAGRRSPEFRRAVGAILELVHKMNK